MSRTGLHVAAAVTVTTLAVSFFAKRRLLSGWDEAARTGVSPLSYGAASGLVALSIPWDLTVGLVLPGRNVLFGERG